MSDEFASPVLELTVEWHRHANLPPKVLGPWLQGLQIGLRGADGKVTPCVRSGERLGRQDQGVFAFCRFVTEAALDRAGKRHRPQAYCAYTRAEENDYLSAFYSACQELKRGKDGWALKLFKGWEGRLEKVLVVSSKNGEPHVGFHRPFERESDVAIVIDFSDGRELMLTATGADRDGLLMFKQAITSLVRARWGRLSDEKSAAVQQLQQARESLRAMMEARSATSNAALDAETPAPGADEQPSPPRAAASAAGGGDWWDQVPKAIKKHCDPVRLTMTLASGLGAVEYGIRRFPVTAEEFASFQGRAALVFPDPRVLTRDAAAGSASWRRAVSWYEARDYCAWLTAQAQQGGSTGFEITLPSRQDYEDYLAVAGQPPQPPGVWEWLNAAEGDPRRNAPRVKLTPTGIKQQSWEKEDHERQTGFRYVIVPRR
jgi:hypothetical protein